MAACTAVPEVGESDLLNNANVKLRSLALMPAVDRRSEYTEQFCKKLSFMEQNWAMVKTVVLISMGQIAVHPDFNPNT